MINDNKIRLLTKTDTTLVYIASIGFAKEITGQEYECEYELYIHVGRDKGSVVVYADNDINKVIQIDMRVRENILKFAEGDR